MSQEPIFERLANLLLERLRREMAPAVLNAPEDIKMTYPGSETDYRFGVYLYHMEELRSWGPPPPIRLDEESRRYPNRLLALSFLLYANRKAPFDSLSALDELVLVEAAMRAVHSMEALTLDGQTVHSALHDPALPEKTALWQSLNSPLQPAVYLTLEPVWVPSSRIRRTPAVRELEVSAKRKGVNQT